MPASVLQRFCGQRIVLYGAESWQGGEPTLADGVLLGIEEEIAVLGGAGGEADVLVALDEVVMVARVQDRPELRVFEGGKVRSLRGSLGAPESEPPATG